MKKRVLSFLLIWTIAVAPPMATLAQAQQQNNSQILQVLSTGTNPLALQSSILSDGLSRIKPLDIEAFKNRTRLLWDSSAGLRVAAMSKGWEYGIRPGIKGVSHTLHKAGETLKTITIIWIIHCVAIVKEEIRKAHLRGREVNTEEYKELFEQAAEHMVNNFEIYSSIIGASAVGAGVNATSLVARKLNFAPQQELLHGMMESSKFRQLFAKMMSAGALSSVIFMGWEAGARLWHESTMLMDTEEEVMAARNLPAGSFLISLLGDNPVGRYLGNSFNITPPTPEQKLMFARVYEKTAEVISNDTGKRWQWFYNSWRHRIATGEFTAMVAAMTAAGLATGYMTAKGFALGAAAGPSIAITSAGLVGGKTGSIIGSLAGPAGAIVFGLAFGVVFATAAGVLVVAVPKPWLDEITNFYRKARFQTNRLKLYPSLVEIRETLNYIVSSSHPSTQGALYNRLRKALRQRGSIRDNMINVWMEKYHNAQLMVQFATYENSLAAMSTNAELDQMVDQLLDAQNEDENASELLRNFLQVNAEFIDSALNDMAHEGAKIPNGNSNSTQASNLSDLRNKVVRNNLELIEEARNEIVQAENLFLNIYINELNSLDREIVTAENKIKQNQVISARTGNSGQFNMGDLVELPNELKTILDAEGKNLATLHENLLYLVLGFNKSLLIDLKDELGLNFDGSVDTLSSLLLNLAQVNLNSYFEAVYSEQSILSFANEIDSEPNPTSL